jgi:2-iminobutanoate/2-iminopropanoate deaminase
VPVHLGVTHQLSGDTAMQKSVIAAAMVAALAVPAAAQQPPGFEKKEHTHSAWTKGIFSDTVTVKGFGTGKLIYLAGVGSEDENGPRGNVRHHGDLVAQCEYAFDKIKRVLAAHGATMNHVVRIAASSKDGPTGRRTSPHF